MIAAQLDQDSAAWLRDLSPDAPGHEVAVARLHGLLLRVTRAEGIRRRASIPERGQDEVDDLCRQAASDAVLAVLRKLPDFRGEARFTTWACKFAIFEISTRLRRHAWRERRIDADERILDRLPDSVPLALVTLQRTETLEFLQQAIREQLTDLQRMVFNAAILEEVPIDVLADRLDSTRGAIYKILHDARRKLRRAMAGAGQELQ
ncbi:MAG: sigma-70 family RNA polymerase sigma factor [Bacillota bacterium]|jgi:RNA polymerase sigma-70 factor (ECF subfamily)